MEQVKTHRYKMVTVEAFETRLFNRDETQRVPVWVLTAIANNPNMLFKDWLVRKPDGSIGAYNDDGFYAEFDRIDAT